MPGAAGFALSSAVETYLQQESGAHRFDVRPKILMLAVYSVGIFFIDTWWGMAAFGAMFVAALVISHANAMRLFKVAFPVYVIAGLTVFFNMFVYMDGSIVFSFEGLVRGAFFATRILLLVWTSLILCMTATSDELTRAFSSIMSPLRVFKVPVDDIATVFSVALRFIPLTVAEFFAIRDAQWARGAKLNEGSLVARIKAHCVIFIPMFIAMFRRADRLALAMDARCYGYPGVLPTNIRNMRVNARSIIIPIFSIALIIIISIAL